MGGYGDGQIRQRLGPQNPAYGPRSQVGTILPQRFSDDMQFLPQPQPPQMGGDIISRGLASDIPGVYNAGSMVGEPQVNNGGGFDGSRGNFGGFNPMMGGDTGSGLGGFKSQFPQYQYQNPQGGDGLQPLSLYKNPQEHQNALRQERGRNEIQRQLNEQFNRDRASGMSMMDAARAQDELGNRLYTQYGIQRTDIARPG
jgi:hypothetical protein